MQLRLVSSQIDIIDRGVEAKKKNGTRASKKLEYVTDYFNDLYDIEEKCDKLDLISYNLYQNINIKRKNPATEQEYAHAHRRHS